MTATADMAQFSDITILHGSVASCLGHDKIVNDQVVTQNLVEISNPFLKYCENTIFKMVAYAILNFIEVISDAKSISGRPM